MRSARIDNTLNIIKQAVFNINDSISKAESSRILNGINSSRNSKHDADTSTSMVQDISLSDSMESEISEFRHVKVLTDMEPVDIEPTENETTTEEKYAPTRSSLLIPAVVGIAATTAAAAALVTTSAMLPPPSTDTTNTSTGPSVIKETTTASTPRNEINTTKIKPTSRPVSSSSSSTPTTTTSKTTAGESTVPSVMLGIEKVEDYDDSIDLYNNNVDNNNNKDNNNDEDDNDKNHPTKFAILTAEDLLLLKTSYEAMLQNLLEMRNNYDRSKEVINEINTENIELEEMVQTLENELEEMQSHVVSAKRKDHYDQYRQMASSVAVEKAHARMHDASKRANLRMTRQGMF